MVQLGHRTHEERRGAKLLEKPGAALFSNYKTTGELSIEQTRTLVSYCFGIVHHAETENPQRLEKAKQILLEQGYRVPMSFPPALKEKDKQNLEMIVELIGEMVNRHPTAEFIDGLARCLSASLQNESQRQGAAMLLQHEKICGKALHHVAPYLKSDEFYLIVRGIFLKAAESHYYRMRAVDILGQAMIQKGFVELQPALATNAAILLNTIADAYGLKIGTQTSIGDAAT